MRKVLTVDDLTGLSGETETLKVTIGGEEVELDLLPSSAQVFRALASKDDAVRESVPSMLAVLFAAEPTTKPGSKPRKPANSESAKIRQWAIDTRWTYPQGHKDSQGHLVAGKPVADRGKIPPVLEAAYRAAHPQTTDTSQVPKPRTKAAAK